jgi:hypothetical protein
MREISRRGMARLAAVFGGALAFWGRSASAAEGGDSQFTGEWLAGEQPCCILGAGRMLLALNDKGDVGSVLVTSPTSIRVIKSDGAWQVGLTAELRGSALVWISTTTGAPITTWTRPVRVETAPPPDERPKHNPRPPGGDRVR